MVRRQNPAGRGFTLRIKSSEIVRRGHSRLRLRAAPRNISAAFAVSLDGRKIRSPYHVYFSPVVHTLVFCWPLALLALIAYPFVWLLLLPFRVVGVAVHGVLEIIFVAITLPFRLLAAPFRI